MIKFVQLDPNGLCNAQCWFCPVAYGGNPLIGKKNMDINLLTNIVEQLHNGIGDFVDLNFNTIFNAHYNEVLLYPEFNKMIEVYEKYKIKTFLFTNGVSLNKNKIDFIKQHSDVFTKIILNIPSAFAEEWSRHTGFNVKIFDKLIENIKYVEEIFCSNSKVKVFIQVNGVENESLFKNGGAIELLKNAPKLNIDPLLGDVEKTTNEFKKLFPKINIYKDLHLNDRSGKLEENNVLTNINSININNFNKKVVSCVGGYGFSLNRAEEWLHINANGDVILCCHDYDFKTSYINIKDKTIKEIWNGPERKEMIKKSYKDFCTKCKYAVWE